VGQEEVTKICCIIKYANRVSLKIMMFLVITRWIWQKCPSACLKFTMTPHNKSATVGFKGMEPLICETKERSRWVWGRDILVIYGWDYDVPFLRIVLHTHDSRDHVWIVWHPHLLYSYHINAVQRLYATEIM